MLYSSAEGGPQLWDLDGPALEQRRAGIMGMDPPQHAQVKRLVVSPFMPRNLDAFEPEVTRVAKQIVDNVAFRGGCEFVFDVASRLPVYTFCVLMGIPQKDHERIFTIGNALADMEIRRPSEKCIWSSRPTRGGWPPKSEPIQMVRG